MGNSPSISDENTDTNTKNSISIIKTEGDKISGVSLIYNKEDEANLLAKIQETLNNQTEVFDTNLNSNLELNKIKDVLNTNTEEFISSRNSRNIYDDIEKDLKSIQEDEEQKEEDVEIEEEVKEQEEKEINDVVPIVVKQKDMEKVLKQIEETLNSNTEMRYR